MFYLSFTWKPSSKCNLATSSFKIIDDYLFVVTCTFSVSNTRLSNYHYAMYIVVVPIHGSLTVLKHDS